MASWTPIRTSTVLYQQRSMIYRMTGEYAPQKVMTVSLIAVVDFYERLGGL